MANTILCLAEIQQRLVEDVERVVSEMPLDEAEVIAGCLQPGSTLHPGLSNAIFVALVLAARARLDRDKAGL